MRRTVIVALVGALLCGVVASWLGPSMIAYWYAPPVPSGAASAFNCTDAITWAMAKLIWTQVIGVVIGALLGVVIGALLGRRKVAPPPAPPASPPAAPPA